MKNNVENAAGLCDNAALRLGASSHPRQPQEALRPAPKSRAGAPVTQPMSNRQTSVWGDQSMRMRRVVRSVSTFLTQLGAALLKAVLMSAVLGLVVVTIMHHMGVPVPSATELLRGLSRVARVRS